MSIFSDIGGLVGAEQGEDAQYAASQQALQLQRDMFNEARQNYKPYQQYSGSADILSRLYGLNGQPADMSAFNASPGYQFRLGEGQRALESSAAARGGLFSGAAGKAMQNYGQNAASQEFDNYVSRLFGMSQMGQNAAAGISNAGQNFANSSSNILGTMGQNQANAKISQWNAIGSLGESAFGAGRAGTEGGGEGGGGFDMGQAAMMFFGG